MRMGKGKGAVDHYACIVRPGAIVFEMDRVSRTVALQVRQLAAALLLQAPPAPRRPLGAAAGAGLGWAGLGWAGLGWAGLGWAGLRRTWCHLLVDQRCASPSAPGSVSCCSQRPGPSRKTSAVGCSGCGGAVMASCALARCLARYGYPQLPRRDAVGPGAWHKTCLCPPPPSHTHTAAALHRPLQALESISYKCPFRVGFVEWN
jgi:hypothetical protein